MTTAPTLSITCDHPGCHVPVARVLVTAGRMVLEIRTRHHGHSHVTRVVLENIDQLDTLGSRGLVIETAEPPAV